jgi:hypothetical protein
MGEDKYNIVAKYGYEGYPANQWIWLQHSHVMWLYRSSFSDDAAHWTFYVSMELGTYQRIEMMKFLWHEAFVNAKMDWQKINYFDLYKSVLERGAFFWSLFKLFWGVTTGGYSLQSLSSRFKTRREDFRCYPSRTKTWDIHYPTSRLSSLYDIIAWTKKYSKILCVMIHKWIIRI